MSITDVDNTSQLMVVIYCLEPGFEKDMISILHQRLDMLHLLGEQLILHRLSAHIILSWVNEKKSYF